MHNIEKLYLEIKGDYEKAQRKVSDFIDKNRHIVVETKSFEKAKLENEANHLSILYNQMAQQLQLSRVKVQNETPVFTIIQPAVEPLRPSKPMKKVILFGSLLSLFYIVL